jgi:hypothetical protein
MDKLFAIAFMCIYLLMSVGVGKTTHYCMGREKSTKIFSYEAKKCPCSLFFAENNDCCDDEHQLLIIDDSQTQSVAFVPSVPDFFPMGEIYCESLSQIFVQTSTQYIRADFSPPPKEPLFKINCSFVFYDSELS